jgi:hypothetical protein
LQKFRIIFWRHQVESTKWQVITIYDNFVQEVHISVVIFILSIVFKSVLSFLFFILVSDNSVISNSCTAYLFPVGCAGPYKLIKKVLVE